MMESAVAIPFGKKVDGAFVPPPSKSHAIRALLIASLARGGSEVRGCGTSDDVGRMADIVRRWRDISKEGDSFVIRPVERIDIPEGVYDCVGSATAARFLFALFSMFEGERVIDGDGSLRKRPVGAGVEAARSLGAEIRFPRNEGCFPVSVRGGRWSGGRVRISDSSSSHSVSGLLIAAPLSKKDLVVEAVEPVSYPYVRMTSEVMKEFGVAAATEGRMINVPRGEYLGTKLEIEKDYSAAAFFLCASAVTDGRIAITGLREDSIQGDAGIAGMLEKIGADVSWKDSSLVCRGKPSKPLEVDLRDIPDLFPPLAALALKCPGRSVFRGTARLEAKESGRGSAVVEAVNAIGGRAQMERDAVMIEPVERYEGAVLDPRGDHRLAMAFAVMGLLAEETTVLDPGCVKKSHPSFWPDFFNILR